MAGGQSLNYELCTKPETCCQEGIVSCSISNRYSNVTRAAPEKSLRYQCKSRSPIPALLVSSPPPIPAARSNRDEAPCSGASWPSGCMPCFSARTSQAAKRRLFARVQNQDRTCTWCSFDAQKQRVFKA